MAEDAVVTESRSSVAIEQNSKGEPAVKVKVYEGFDPDALEAVRIAAVSTYEQTVAAVGA